MASSILLETVIYDIDYLPECKTSQKMEATLSNICDKQNKPELYADIKIDQEIFVFWTWVSLHKDQL